LRINTQLTAAGRKELAFLKDVLRRWNGRTLDVGCGNMVDRLGFKPGGEYVGVDVVPTKYTSAMADIHHLPFRDHSFDGLICNSVLEHVARPEVALSELGRVLKTSGTLFLSTPFLQHVHAPYDFRRFTPQGLRQEVERAGFVVDDLYCNCGVLDSVEYLLFSAVGWRTLKDKDLQGAGSWLYVVVLAGSTHSPSSWGLSSRVSRREMLDTRRLSAWWLTEQDSGVIQTSCQRL